MQTTSARRARPSWPDPERCTVEVLVVSGCPSTELTVARIREAADALGLETNLRFLIVDSEEQAQAMGFKGSPTVKVEGIDVDESAEERPVGLTCRLYPVGDVLEHAPPLSWIRDALARAVPLLGLST